MKRVIIIPWETDILPTRRSPLKQWKLDSLEKAFKDNIEALPKLIIFERGNNRLMADGNHRTLLAMKYSLPLPAIQLAEGESFTLHGNPLLNYGKHEEYNYENYGQYAAYIVYCRLIAKFRGYKDFNRLYDEHMLDQSPTLA